MIRFAQKIFLKLTPANHLAILLSILSIIEAVHIGLSDSLHATIHFLLFAIILLIASLGIFEILNRLTKKKKPYSHVIISTLMIYLVLNHDEHNLITAMILLFSLHFVKFFINDRKKIIFNPVAFAIVVTTLFSVIIPSLSDASLKWDSLQSKFVWFENAISLPLFFMGLSIFTNAKRIKRIPIALSFICTSILLKGMISVDLDLDIYFISVFFIGGLVIIEPKSSPMKDTEQIGLGIFTGLIFFILTALTVPSDAMLAVVISNFVFYIYKTYKQ